MDRPFLLNEDPDFLFVTAEEEGIRIDKLLTGRYPDHSRTYFQYCRGDGELQLVIDRREPKRALHQQHLAADGLVLRSLL